jgi:aryl-alcohol dehydrogenase-like predicted oxidoreductase
MKPSFSRRDFLAAGLAAPAAAGGFSQTKSRNAKLTFRTLGNTGLKVTTLSFGCMTASDPSVIVRAADLGIRHFDTARGYQNGNNERMVGAALKGKRQQAIIASKSGSKTKQGALADLETSLRELGTDYLDIWYLHMKNEPAEMTDELLEAQRIAKKDGKIRFSGVSTHFNMDRMLAYLAKLGQTDVVLTTYNFAMRSVAGENNTNTQAPKTDMTEAIRAARKAGMGIVAMKALAGGVSRVQRGDRLYGANPQALSEHLARAGVPLAAIKWVLKNESVDTAIVCMTNHDQLDLNVRAMAEPYTERDAEVLAARFAYLSPIYCRMCGSCGGTCAKGVPVADMLRFLTYAEGYGQFALAREKFLELPASARAVRCTDCDACRVACPNGVRVKERLSRAQDMFA